MRKEVEFSMDKIDDLILLLLEGTISSEDRQDLKNWVNASAENRRYFKDRVRIWQLTGAVAKNRYHKDAAFEAFKLRVAAENTKEKPKTRIISLSRIYKYAACFLLFLLVGGVSYFLINNRDNQSPKPLFYAVNTPEKSKMKVDLPDGSVVWLNTSSKLVYDSQFGISNRHLALSGEAYFEIAKNEGLPLIVSLDDAEVKVLGTKFNVTNYQTDAEIHVALLQGSVEFIDKRTNKNVIMKPDQMICLDKNSRSTKLKNIKAQDYNGWINNKLFFDEETLGQIAKELERAMGVSIIFEDDDLKNQVFYGGLSIDTDDIRELMDVMAATNQFGYEYDAKSKTVRLFQK